MKIYQLVLESKLDLARLDLVVAVNILLPLQTFSGLGLDSALHGARTAHAAYTLSAARFLDHSLDC